MNRALTVFLVGSLLVGAPGYGLAQTQNDPHSSTGARLPPRANVSVPDSTLPPGSVVVRVLDGRGAGVPGADVELRVSHETVAEGSSEEVRRTKAGSDGNARFEGLPTGTGYSFTVGVDRAPARYATDPFALRRDRGHQVVLHVFPATSDIQETMVAGQLLLYLEPREDVFQFTVLLELYNVGEITWVPQNAGFRFPEGWRGFNPQETNGTVHVEPTGDSLQLVGSVSPGQHSVTFGVQVPRDDTPGAAVSLGLPPRMATIRVMAESSPRMELAVAGFPEARVMTNRDHERVLVTQVQAGRSGVPLIDRVDIRVGGLATRGNGRWISLWLALGVAGIGVSVAVRGKRQEGGGRGGDVQQAREVLFAELVKVEKAFRAGRIGPETHRQAQQTLLDALARLETLGPERLGEPVTRTPPA